jgi:predicted NAD/FAD-binding protein
VVGAGWGGLAAAVGHPGRPFGHVVFSKRRASPAAGPAASTSNLPDGTPAALDNGQHILIGAYTETLRLMREVGVVPEDALLRLPLSLRFPRRRRPEAAATAGSA